MRIESINTVEAKEVRIGKSAKVSIIVNGDVYIKSCKAGLWNCLVVCEYTEKGYKNLSTSQVSIISTKHRDECSAQEQVDKSNKDTYAIDANAEYKIIKVTPSA
jgi:hypothetical protein